jgi:hypothetical protein
MEQQTPSKRTRRRARKRSGAPKQGLRKAPPITFVGGTGRSGTHVVSRMLGRHGKLQLIPVECRFHVEERGYPGLLAGRTSKAAFMRRMRGFWWRGFQSGRMRGMHRFVPRERYDRALLEFDSLFEIQPEKACRDLFWDLLWPFEDDEGVSGIVEQSCDSVAQAPTLLELFPTASFVHVVRDGRDASASRVGQTHGLIYPRTRAQGIEWWEERLRAMDAGARAVSDERLVEVSLDELLADPRFQLEEIFTVLGVSPGRKVRRFLRNRMSQEQANTERWRTGISARKRDRIDGLYREALDRLEDDGIRTVPLLRRTYERRAEAGR